MLTGVVLAVVLMAPQWRTTPTRTPRPTVVYEPTATPTPYPTIPIAPTLTPTRTPRPTVSATPIPVVSGERVRVTVEIAFPGQEWATAGQYVVEMSDSRSCVLSVSDDCAVRITRYPP